MSKPSKREVVDAIISYSPERLQYLINQGFDVNLPLYGSHMDTCDPPGDDYEPGDEQIIALSTAPGATPMTYLLHVAVVCLYHSAIKGYTAKYKRNQALKCIDILLNSGAKCTSGTGEMFIFNAPGYNWITFWAESPENSPLHLAMFLKKYEGGCSNEVMDDVIKRLQVASKPKKKGNSSLVTTPILKSVADRYKMMLFSPNFSDVVFECSDGVSVPAHKIILATSSPYFATAFQGNWSENNSDGIWRTAHSSKLIKSVLTLVYTGSVEECEKLLNDKGTDPLDLMDLACEYEIKPLILICVDNCKKNLKVGNVKKVLQNAHLHNCGPLKRACFGFVQKNTAKALMDPEMMKLATEAPELWSELGTFLNGAPAKPSKRARKEN